MAARNTRQTLTVAGTAALLALAAACQTPSINLATSQPIKVDIAMRLDVYEHNGGTAPGVVTGAAAATPAPTPARGANSAERRKNRAADIQVFKNSRLIGEGHKGLLVVLVETEGDYGDYVRRTVAEENADRMAQMKEQAEKEKRPLPEVQKDQAALWSNRSFKGEWLEVAGADGTWSWQQKKG